MTGLFLVPLLPLLGFALLALAGGRMSERTIALVGTTAGGVSVAAAVVVAATFLGARPEGSRYSQVLWTWLDAAGFAPRVALYLDGLALIMMLVITFVGFLILVYSTAFMRGEEGYRRFFAYMDLFIGSMLVLVLARDLLLLLLGWEGVGLSSYLLIGFWYREPANGAAARKAFIVTRLGDVALLVGLLLVFTQTGSLDIPQVSDAAGRYWTTGSAVTTAAALLFLGGAAGKSAQLPLQTWLPDAMAGPTPVSALIHAATMVTAGVYLIARMHVLFELSPAVLRVVAIIGAVTLLYGATCALAQWDIKRVLAYSTISQIGYMFVALGVGAWSAALFHFMTHAFFKALLFLAAGLVVKATGGEHDIRRMGGLRRAAPFTFWMFLVGAASLSALPLVTAGFYSKDLITGLALTSDRGGVWLYLAAVIGAFLTSVYAFRLVFMVFFGRAREPRAPFAAGFSRSMTMPVAVLGALAVVGGFVELPHAWGGPHLVTTLLESSLPPVRTSVEGVVADVVSPVVMALVSLSGVQLAALLFLPMRRAVPGAARASGARRLPALAAAGARAGWGFDRLYGLVFVKPFVRTARAAAGDPVDALTMTPARASVSISAALAASQRGKVRYYVGAAAFGVLVFVAVGVWA